MKRKIFTIAVLVFTLIFSVTAFADYERTADNTVPAYQDPGLTNRTGNERVDRGDRVIVHEETANAYRVTYPTPRGQKTRWVPKNIFNGGGNSGGGNISPSGYAYPLGKRTAFGNGHDCAIAEGTPVYAIESGTANFYQVMGTYNGRYATVSYGNFIELNCDNGTLAKY